MSLRSATVDADKNKVREEMNELDDINKKIMSVLTANDALPHAPGLNISSSSLEKANPNCSNSVSTRFSLTRDASLCDWLHDLRLDDVYERLVENGFDDLEEMLEQQRSGIRLLPSMLQDIGLDKPGQRYILLAALELESQRDMPQIRKSHRGHTISCLSPLSPMQSVTAIPSLEKWLESLSLEGYVEAFEKGGFEHLEQILGLMHTSYKVTEDIMEMELGVKKLGHRHRMLGSLQEMSMDADPVRLLFTSGRRRTVKPIPDDPSCSLM